METGQEGWRRCSGCKKWIGFEARYYTCNVSTCNRKRTGLVFCSVSCWEVHLPTMRHREAWAEDQRSPSRASAQQLQAASGAKPEAAAGSDRSHESGNRERPETERQGRRILARPASSAPRDELPREVLIVASRLKHYIKARADMNVSDRVLLGLSDHVRKVCEDAIQAARRDGRKTILDRDIPKP